MVIIMNGDGDGDGCDGFVDMNPTYLQSLAMISWSFPVVLIPPRPTRSHSMRSSNTPSIVLRRTNPFWFPHTQVLVKL